MPCTVIAETRYLDNQVDLLTFHCIDTCYEVGHILVFLSSHHIGNLETQEMVLDVADDFWNFL